VNFCTRNLYCRSLSVAECISVAFDVAGLPCNALRLPSAISVLSPPQFPPHRLSLCKSGVGRRRPARLEDTPSRPARDHEEQQLAASRVSLEPGGTRARARATIPDGFRAFGGFFRGGSLVTVLTEHVDVLLRVKIRLDLFEMQVGCTREIAMREDERSIAETAPAVRIAPITARTRREGGGSG